MRVLVFNSKGGCGKSLVTREIIAGPLGKDTVIAEIDPINKTQQIYADQFGAVIELAKEDVKDLIIHLNEHSNIVVDVGADCLTQTINTMVEYDLFEDIDKVVIPLIHGRTDAENALKTYKTLKPLCDNIVFAFSRYNPEEGLKGQYPSFFANVDKFIEGFGEDHYVTIDESSVFHDAQHDKKLVIQLAEDIDHKSAALTAKKEGDDDKFRDLMRLELHKKAAQILVKKVIMPAHEKILR